MNECLEIQFLLIFIMGTILLIKFNADEILFQLKRLIYWLEDKARAIEKQQQQEIEKEFEDYK